MLIESPDSGFTRSNYRYALAAMRDSFVRGEAPLHANLGMLDGDALFAWMDKASFVAVYQDLGVSNGMRRVIDRAIAVGHRVEFRTVPGWIP